MLLNNEIHNDTMLYGFYLYGALSGNIKIEVTKLMIIDKFNFFLHLFYKKFLFLNFLFINDFILNRIFN